MEMGSRVPPQGRTEKTELLRQQGDKRSEEERRAEVSGDGKERERERKIEN